MNAAALSQLCFGERKREPQRSSTRMRWRRASRSAGRATGLRRGMAGVALPAGTEVGRHWRVPQTGG